MIDKILIFNTDINIPDTTSKNDRDIFYEQFDKNIPKVFVESFYQLEQYDKFAIDIKSTIDTIILQQVLAYTIPIIDSIPDVHDIIWYKPKEKLRSPYVQEENKGIVFKLEYDQICIYNGIYIRIPKYTTITIIGLRINKGLDRSKSVNLSLVDTDYLDLWRENLPENDKILNGLITNYNHFTNKFYKHPQVNPINTDSITEFNDDKNTIKLNGIATLLKSSREYYENRVHQLHNEIGLINIIPHEKKVSIPINRALKAQNPILRKLENILGVSMLYKNYRNIMLSIFNMGYYDTYQKIMTGDTETNDRLKYTIDIKKSVMEQQSVLYKRQLEILRWRNIAFQKFGKWQHLTKQQRDIADLIYKNSLDAVKPSKDLDKKMQLSKSLLGSMQTGNVAEIESILSQIGKYKSIETGILCRHNITKANMLTNVYKSELDKNRILRNELINKYGDVYDNTYYCRICGEKLSEMQQGDQISITNNDYRYDMSYDELYYRIYKEASYICNNFVSFRDIQMYSIITIIKNITDIVKDEIHAIEISLKRIKTFKNYDISLTLGIYIYVYIFAFITQLIYTNDSIAFKSNLFTVNQNATESSPYIVGAKSNRVKKPMVKSPKKMQIDMDSMLRGKTVNTKTNIKHLQKLINTAISILINIKNKDIQSSPVITLQNIKGIFLNAYRFITKINYTTLVYSNEDYWYNNPIIDYFVYATIKKQNLDGKDKNKDTIMELALGRSKKQIISDLKDKEKRKTNDIYHTLVDPERWTSDVYVNDSLRFLYQYIHGKFYKENPANYSKEYVEFIEKYKHLKSLERLRVNRNRFSEFRPLYNPMVIMDIGYTTVKSMFRSCNGKCDKYIYRKINDNGDFIGEETTISKQEIDDWIMNKDYKKLKWFQQWKLVEIKCSCKISDRDTDMQVFYDYYRNNCVFGDIHTFNERNNVNTCSKCGITDIMIDELDPTFYKRHLARYTKLKNIEKRESEIKKDLMNINKPNIDNHIERPHFKTWEMRTDNIKKLADLLDWNPNKIYNIGLYEKRTYSKDFDVTKLTPSQDDLYKRNNTLYGYYLYIVRSYYKLRNFDMIPYPPPIIKEFVKKFNTVITKKLDLINLHSLPEIEFRMQTLKTSELTNFLLDMVSSTLLHIYRIFEKNGIKKIGLEFIKTLLEDILKFEKNLGNFDMRKMLRKINKNRPKDRPAVAADDIINTIEDDIVADDVMDEMDVLDLDESMGAEMGEEVDEMEDRDLFSLDDVDIEEYDEDTLYKDVVDKLND